MKAIIVVLLFVVVVPVSSLACMEINEFSFGGQNPMGIRWISSTVDRAWWDEYQGKLRCIVDGRFVEAMFILAKIDGLNEGDVLSIELKGLGNGRLLGFWGQSGMNFEEYSPEAFTEEVHPGDATYDMGQTHKSLYVPQGVDSLIIGMTVTSTGSIMWGQVDKLRVAMPEAATIEFPGGVVGSSPQSIGGLKAMFR